VTQPLHRHRLRIALTTGVVSAFFSILFQAIEEFLSLAPGAQLKELIVIAITSIGMLLAVEPILEKIAPVRVRQASARTDNVLIRTGAFFTIVATSLMHGLLHAHVSESITAHGMLVLEQLLAALVAPTLITLAWTFGIRRDPPQARWYGLAVGMTTGLGLVVLAMVQLYFLRPPAGLREASPHDAAMSLLLVATSLLWFIVPTCAVNGYLGGLALDRQWRAKSWRSVTQGLMIAVAVETAAFFMAAMVQSYIFPTATIIEPDLLLELICEVTVANLGWAMGVWVSSDADATLCIGQKDAGRSLRSELLSGVASAAAMLGLGLMLSVGAVVLGSHIRTTSSNDPSLTISH
jgi:hypothetical protein